MIEAVESMPIFTASAPKSESTESIWAATNSGGRLKTPCTPTEFWAVTAVSTDMPNTRNAEKVFRSAWIPAPPPESDPAMVSALGTLISQRVYAGREGATNEGRRGRDDRLALARAWDDHGELAADGSGLQALEVSSDRGGHDFLELLGQLTGHHDLLLAVDLADGLEGGHDAVRR